MDREVALVTDQDSTTLWPAATEPGFALKLEMTGTGAGRTVTVAAAVTEPAPLDAVSV